MVASAVDGFPEEEAALPLHRCTVQRLLCSVHSCTVDLLPLHGGDLQPRLTICVSPIMHMQTCNGTIQESLVIWPTLSLDEIEAIAITSFNAIPPVS